MAVKSERESKKEGGRDGGRERGGRGERERVSSDKPVGSSTLTSQIDFWLKRPNVKVIGHTA